FIPAGTEVDRESQERNRRHAECREQPRHTPSLSRACRPASTAVLYSWRWSASSKQIVNFEPRKVKFDVTGRVLEPLVRPAGSQVCAPRSHGAASLEPFARVFVGALGLGLGRAPQDAAIDHAAP